MEKVDNTYALAAAKKIAEDQAKMVASLSQPLIVPKNYTTFTTTGTNHTITGNPINSMNHGNVVVRKVTDHGEGFFSDIRIFQDDVIRYKLYRAGWFGKLLFKLRVWEPRDEDGYRPDWKQIPNQINSNQNLEVNLGLTYLQIDEQIASDLEADEHEDFIKEMAETDPENLKMIAGLKTLDDGMKAPLRNPLNGTSGTGS